MSRGFFAIGIVAGKCPDNLGGLWRSAHSFGASFIFTVGHRYPHQPTDTTKAWKHIPLLEFQSVDGLLQYRPKGCEVVAVECGRGIPKPLTAFTHPERAIYLLGAEDTGIPIYTLGKADRLVEIPGDYCLNVATAGSILMYDRIAKEAS